MSQMMTEPQPPPPDRSQLGEMGAEPPGGPPLAGPGGGGLPPELMAALSGGAGGNSQDILAEGPLAGQDTATAEEPSATDPVDKVRQAIQLLREAGMDASDDVMSHAIDKAQADLQKILSGESQKTSKLRSALGG